MYSILLLGLISAIASLLVTPVVRNLFLHWNLVDKPDPRKLHSRRIPRVGGVAIAIAYLTAFGVLLVIGWSAGQLVWSARTDIWHLFPAAAVIFAVGLADDLLNLEPWQKLIGQLVAAVLAVYAGVHASGVGPYQLGTPWSYMLTIGWLLLCTNAVNLIDGIDGLAAGVGLFATITTLLAALLQNNVELALATAPLAGALLGFLRYNFNPATIFLGDSGSLLVGFLLGCFGVIWSQKSATILGMTAPLMALAIPLLDTLLAIVRRFLRRQPIFGPDRGHIHHRLLERGYTHRKAALVLYVCCAVGAFASLGVMNQSISGFVIVIFCGAAWLGVQHLGYIEFGLLGRMFIEGAFRRQLSAQIALHCLERELTAATTPSDCLQCLQTAAREFGFHHVEVEIGDHRLEYTDPVQPIQCWTIRVPIADRAFIQLSREFNVLGYATAVAAFADIVRRTLLPKLQIFESTPAIVRIASSRD